MKTNARTADKKCRPGLTLLELMVVLVILAAMTTIAVQSVNGLADQARYDATQKTLQNTQDACLGSINSQGPDGGQIFTGFVADLGRLPQVVLENRANNVQVLTLQELWNPLSPVAQSFPFAIRTPKGTDADAAISLPCGWRGPYLRMPLGAGTLLDGWGQELASPFPPVTGQGNLLDLMSNTVTASGQTVFQVRSLGSQIIGDTYNQVLSVALNPNRFLGTVQGQVNAQVFSSGTDITSQAALSGTVVVKIFVPDSNTGSVLAVKTPAAGATGALALGNVDPTSGGSVSFMPANFTDGYSTLGATSIGQVTVGTRVIRAYFTFTPPSGGAATTFCSTPVTLIVRPGANVIPPLRITVIIP
jgi:prepilin-type N-terminal cleavage/methylation domain-containing protein